MLPPTLVLLVAASTVAAPPELDFGDAFADIHRTVAEHFYDPELRGLDWDEIGRTYGARASAAASLDAFADIVNEMLDELGTSHTTFFTERQPRYWQLLSIFEGYLEEAIRAAHPDNVDLRYPGIGFFTSSIDGGIYVAGVLEGGPAEAAGLRVGDRIIAADERPFQPIGSFEGHVGASVAMTIARSPTETLTIPVEPDMIDPAALFMRAMDRSIRVIEHDGARIGYVHLWSAAGPQYTDLLESEVAYGRLRDADALIIDLRGGWGGANPSNLNLFNRAVPTMTHIERDGTRQLIDSQWRKPVALLVDGGSRSGKEVVAHGFRKHAIGPVVGSRTAGAVVGGRPFLIRPGMLLYLAVIDVEVDGERIEGVGVTPDVAVEFALPYANGDDPQLEAALDAVGATP